MSFIIDQEFSFKQMPRLKNTKDDLIQSEGNYSRIRFYYLVKENFLSFTLPKKGKEFFATQMFDQSFWEIAVSCWETFSGKCSGDFRMCRKFTNQQR